MSESDPSDSAFAFPLGSLGERGGVELEGTGSGVLDVGRRVEAAEWKASGWEGEGEGGLRSEVLSSNGSSSAEGARSEVEGAWSGWDGWEESGGGDRGNEEGGGSS